MKLMFKKLCVVVTLISLAGYIFGDMVPLYILIGGVFKLGHLIYLDLVEEYTGEIR